MKDLVVLLGRRVHELRAAKKWSQEAFADVSGLHRTYIGQIERGEKNISFGNLIKISAVLGVTASELLSVLDGDSPQHKEPGHKQEGGHAKAIQGAQGVHEIHKLLKRLKHQRDAMDQTMALLDELTVALTKTVTSPARLPNGAAPAKDRRSVMPRLEKKYFHLSRLSSWAAFAMQIPPAGCGRHPRTALPAYIATRNLIASLGAFTRSCFVPRYRSVV